MSKHSQELSVLRGLSCNLFFNSPLFCALVMSYLFEGLWALFQSRHLLNNCGSGPYLILNKMVDAHKSWRRHVHYAGAIPGSTGINFPNLTASSSPDEGGSIEVIGGRGRVNSGATRSNSGGGQSSGSTPSNVINLEQELSRHYVPLNLQWVVSRGGAGEDAVLSACSLVLKRQHVMYFQ